MGMTEAEVEERIRAVRESGATELDLQFSGLKRLPETIADLGQLKVLWLYSGRQSSISDWIGNLVQLEELWLEANDIQFLPESIGNLAELQLLFLSNNQLERLPESIGNLIHLEKLDLEDNQLVHLPESIGNLTQLRELNLQFNQLHSLPESFHNLTQLENLDLAHNQLRTLPESLRNLQKLDILYLSDNPHLTSLPRNFKVRYLDVADCTRLDTLPDDLVVTEWLDVADTALTRLPSSLRRVGLLWRRIPIDERIAFHPETITHEEVLAETNAEKRRVLLERMGYERFMREAQPDVLDTDQDAGGERKLLRIELQNDEPLVCLSVIDPSTSRQYMLRVPPTTTSCRQAAAWIAGFDDPDDYKPLVET